MSADGFNYDNMFMRLLNRLGDVVLLSVIFVLFSVPIFTIGASVTAMYYTAMKSISGDDGYIWKYFVKSFKENFRQSTVIWLISVVALGIFGVDTWYWIEQNKLGTTGLYKFMIVLSVILLTLAVFTVMYVFAVQSKFDNRTSVQIRNALLLAIKNFPRTLLMSVVLVVVVWCFYYAPVLAVVGFALIGFGIVGYFFGYLMLISLKPYLVTAAESNDEELDEEIDGDKEADGELDEEADADKEADGELDEEADADKEANEETDEEADKETNDETEEIDRETNE